MNLEHVKYEREGGIATFTLDRPERLNALTFDSYRELTDAFRALRDDDELRCVVITGTGRAFCSGGDVKDIIGRLFGVSDEELLAFTRMTCDLIENIRLLEVPVIASLNGTTCGAGAAKALAAMPRELLRALHASAEIPGRQQHLPRAAFSALYVCERAAPDSPSADL